MASERNFADGRLSHTKQTHKTVEDAEQVIGKQQALPIVDQAAYDEYVRLGQSPILTTKKMHTASDGTTINLGKMPHHVQKDIQHLPPPEQQKIMKLKQVFQQMQNKRTGLFRKAYGTNVKGDGTPATDKVQSTLDLKRPELIELFGKMFSLAEVHEVVLKLWKLPIKKDTLEAWRIANQDAITVRMEQHKREYSDIRLVHKRSRLEELVWLYNHRKNIYQNTRKGEDHRLLMTTLQQIKQEVEGDSIRVDHNLQINVDDVSGQLKDTFSFISIKEIVVARVAAKMGKEPLTIIKAMSQGYYHQNLHAEVIEEEMPAYPSTSTYDFDRIQKQHAQAEQNKQFEAPVAQLQPAQLSQAEMIKQALIKKLQEKQQDVNYTKNSLNPLFIDKANS